MNRPFFVQGDSGVKSTSGTHYVQCGLTIVTLAGLIHLGLCKNNQGCTELIPLELDFVAFIERLLRDRSVELGDVEDLDRSWLALKLLARTSDNQERNYLALWNEYSHGRAVTLGE